MSEGANVKGDVPRDVTSSLTWDTPLTFAPTGPVFPGNQRHTYCQRNSLPALVKNTKTMPKSTGFVGVLMIVHVVLTLEDVD